MKKGQACRGKGIDGLYRYGYGITTKEARRMFWKQHRTAEKAEIREQLSAEEKIIDGLEWLADWLESGELSPRERAILATMGAE